MVERRRLLDFRRGGARAGRCLPTYLRRDRKETLYVANAGMARSRACDKSVGRAKHRCAGGGACARRERGLARPCWSIFLRIAQPPQRWLTFAARSWRAVRFEAQMKVDLFLKDFKLHARGGATPRVALPLTSNTSSSPQATAAAGRGEEDLAAIITTLDYSPDWNMIVLR